MSHRIRRGLFPGGDLYSKRIQEFSGNLVAHWPLNELSGSTAYDKSIGQFNGAITTATPGQKGIGDGLTSMFFDGTNNYIDISAIASNLITNGGFETAGAGGADIWAGWGETVSDGALANEGVVIHTGADAAKITAGASANTYILSYGITVIPGATYRLRVWTQGDGTHDGRLRIYNVTDLEWMTASTKTGVTGAAYAKVDFDFTVPAGCTSISVYLYCPDTDTHFVYFDTCSLRRTDIPTFDPHEGSIIVWPKVDDWEDGAIGYFCNISVNISNFVSIQKQAANNTVLFRYVGNNTTKSQATSGLTSSRLVPYGITWSLLGDKVSYYIDGVPSGATATGLGAWCGNLASNTIVLGASTTNPNNVLTGNLAHAQLYNTPHDANTMKYLMSLP